MMGTERNFIGSSFDKDRLLDFLDLLFQLFVNFTVHWANRLNVFGIALKMPISAVFFQL